VRSSSSSRWCTALALDPLQFLQCIQCIQCNTSCTASVF
jgi:hypothetical protein